MLGFFFLPLPRAGYSSNTFQASEEIQRRADLLDSQPENFGFEDEEWHKNLGDKDFEAEKKAHGKDLR